jgi:hypothetical protein
MAYRQGAEGELQEWASTPSPMQEWQPPVAGWTLDITYSLPYPLGAGYCFCISPENFPCIPKRSLLNN